MQSGSPRRRDARATPTRAQELDAKRLSDLWQGIKLTDQDKDRAAPAMLDLIAALQHKAEQESGDNESTLALLERLEREASN